MPAIVTDDGVKLHAEETGQGEPLLFVHEFAGDHRSWEPQVRFFSAAYRCVTYAARGYPPSDVPTDPEAYSQERAVAFTKRRTRSGFALMVACCVRIVMPTMLAPWSA